MLKYGPNPDKPVVAKRKSSSIGELTIEYLYPAQAGFAPSFFDSSF
jgi:hypothetical protein